MGNYTGNPSATQAPSPTPDAGSPPIVAIPNDGDPANAASVTQMVKVLADFNAFAQGPFPAPSAWTQNIWSVKDALGNKRWYLDHFGVPRDSRIAWTEDFTPGTAFNVTGAGSFAVGRQRIVTLGAASLTSSADPGSTYANPPFPAALAGTVAPSASRQFAGILDGNSVGNRVEIRLDDNYCTAAYANDTIISCEWDFENFTNNAVIWVLGFAESGEFVNNIQHGAFFIRPNTAGANWLCRTINGGSPTEVDSGVLAGTTRRTFRIDMVGSSMSDDSTSRVFFWIDGSLVTNITATLAINAARHAEPLCGGVVQASGGGPYPTAFLLNTIRYAQLTRIATP